MTSVAIDDLIRFACPACGKRLKSPVEHQGKRARCRCGERVIVPAGEFTPANFGDAPVSSFDFAALSTSPNHQDLTTPARWSNQPVVNGPAEPTASNLPAIARSQAAGQTFTLQYQATSSQLWEATLEYLGKLPDLSVLVRDDEARQLRYRSQHFQHMVQVQIVELVPGQAEVRVCVERETTTNTSPMASDVSNGLIIFASYKTQGLDPKFKQVGGLDGSAEVRSAGVWKMVWGGLICLGGLVATAMTDGQVLFYGAILWGGFLFVAGAIQTAFGKNIE